MKDTALVDMGEIPMEQYLFSNTATLIRAAILTAEISGWTKEQFNQLLEAVKNDSIYWPKLPD